MIRWLLAGLALVVEGFKVIFDTASGHPDRGGFSEQEEPVREPDAWDRMMHHDDVTPEEAARLDDPAVVAAIEERQAVTKAWFEDREARNETFMEAYRERVDPPSPTGMHEGWDDDEDMPETFYARDEETGELIEVRFDSLPEWRNEAP